MSRPLKQSLLAEQVELLVKHFGADRVRSALAKASSVGQAPYLPAGGNGQKRERLQRGTSLHLIESVRESRPETSKLLHAFFLRLQNRDVLPTSEDIRHFSQRIGLKEIGGKRREDMLLTLIRFLIDQPLEKLRADIEDASGISEHQRQMGYSILTEKLLGRP